MADFYGAKTGVVTSQLVDVPGGYNLRFQFKTDGNGDARGWTDVPVAGKVVWATVYSEEETGPQFIVRVRDEYDADVLSDLLANESTPPSQETMRYTVENDDEPFWLSGSRLLLEYSGDANVYGSVHLQILPAEPLVVQEVRWETDASGGDVRYVLDRMRGVIERLVCVPSQSEQPSNLYDVRLFSGDIARNLLDGAGDNLNNAEPDQRTPARLARYTERHDKPQVNFDAVLRVFNAGGKARGHVYLFLQPGGQTGTPKAD